MCLTCCHVSLLLRDFEETIAKIVCRATTSYLHSVLAKLACHPISKLNIAMLCTTSEKANKSIQEFFFYCRVIIIFRKGEGHKINKKKN